MCLTQFYTAEKTIVKLLFTSSSVLSLRDLPPFTPSTSKWYFASTEQNLNRGRLSLVLNLEHTNLSNCQAYWNVFFPILSSTYFKRKKIWSFFYYEVSLRHCITTYDTPCVRLWCIVLSACCQWIWRQYPTPQKQFILYSYSIYCPWLYAFQIHLPSITKGTARSKPEKLSAEKHAIPKFLNFWTYRRVCSESLESWGGGEAQKEISRLIQTYGRHEDVGEWEKEGKDTQNKRPCRRVHSLPTSWKTCHGHLPFKCDDI